MMLPKKKEIIPPNTGWKECTYYIVEVAFAHSNPIHRRIFYSGFLNSAGNPGGYNQFFTAKCEMFLGIEDVWYMKVLGKVEYEIDNP